MGIHHFCVGTYIRKWECVFQLPLQCICSTTFWHFQKLAEKYAGGYNQVLGKVRHLSLGPLAVGWCVWADGYFRAMDRPLLSKVFGWGSAFSWILIGVVICQANAAVKELFASEARNARAASQASEIGRARDRRRPSNPDPVAREVELSNSL